jgi:hypothetical protein
MKEQTILLKIRDDLKKFLASIPFIETNQSKLEIPSDNIKADLTLEIKIDGKLQTLLVECKSIGEPRMIRMAIQQLRESVGLFENAYPMVAAPFISNDAANICKQSKVVILIWRGTAI